MRLVEDLSLVLWSFLRSKALQALERVWKRDSWYFATFACINCKLQTIRAFNHVSCFRFVMLNLLEVILHLTRKSNENRIFHKNLNRKQKAISKAISFCTLSDPNESDGFSETNQTRVSIWNPRIQVINKLASVENLNYRSWFESSLE